jgi:hypothetical protein
MAERPIDLELVAELRELSRYLETPAPDLTAVVRARLTREPPAAPARFATVPRRWLVAAAAVVVALVIALVPQGRAAVAHAVTGFLRFAGVEVRHGTPAPAVSPSPLPAVHSAGLDEARRRARFPVGVPTRLGVPDDVQLADPAPDGAPRVVSLIYRGGAVRLDEFDGELDVGFMKTSSTNDSQWIDLDGVTGIWFPTPHEVAYVDRFGVTHRETARMAGSTLIWSKGTVTYRLEGVSTLEEAAAIASSVH